MKILKNLSQDDLNNISDFLSNEINREISNIVEAKEIIDIEVNIEIQFDDKERVLDVDSDVNLETDGLREISDDIITEAVDRAYLKLDNYIEAHYKENKE